MKRLTLALFAALVLLSLNIFIPIQAKVPHLQGAPPVSFWRMEEVSGTRFDDIGSNDLTDNNTVGSSTDAQEGIRSADIEKDNNEYLSISDGSQSGLDITGDLTIVSWVKLESLVAFERRDLVSKYNTTGNQRGYTHRITEEGAIQFFLSPDGATFTEAFTADSLISAGSWYHIAVVYNGTDMRIYVDGSLANNGANNPKTYSGGINNNTAEFRIGFRQNADALYDGLVDEAAIFDRALSAAEISDIYNFGLDYLLATPTPTPTATSPPLPTNTPSSIYTHTLTSGHLLVVDTTADFGEIIISATVLLMVTLLVFGFVYRVVYRR